MPSKATNPQNLIPQSERPIEERRRIAAMGGKARGEQKKRQKTFREALETLLSKEVIDKNGDKYDLLTAISAKQVEKASKGDTKAFEVIRDTIGQKPVERVEITEWDTKIAGEIEAYVDGRKA